MKKSVPTPSSAVSASSRFRVFAQSMGLILAEIGFWLAILLTWYGVQRVAPNVQLEQVDWWGALLLLPASLVFFLLGLRQKQLWAKTLADEELWPRLFPSWRPQLHGWRFFLWRLAFASILIGILDIKVGARLKEVKSEGVDVMIALDVSTSMRAEDTGTSRLDLAKQSGNASSMNWKAIGLAW